MTLLQIGSTDGLIGISSIFFIRLLINVITSFILIRYVYFPINKTRDYVFLFLIFNLLIFIITYLLSSVNISIGTAFGLFAVFSVLHYRTETMSVKNMTYIFLLISIGLINGVMKLTWEFISLINIFILTVTYLLENFLLKNKQTQQTEICINLEFIKLEQQENLIENIEMRLGAKVIRLSVKKVDFVKQNAIIDVCYCSLSKEIINNKNSRNLNNEGTIFEITDPVPLNNFVLPLKTKNTFLDIDGEKIQGWIEQKPKDKFKIKDRDLKFKEGNSIELPRERKKEKRKLA